MYKSDVYIERNTEYINMWSHWPVLWGLGHIVNCCFRLLLDTLCLSSGWLSQLMHRTEVSPAYVYIHICICIQTWLKGVCICVYAYVQILEAAVVYTYSNQCVYTHLYKKE